MRLEAGTQLRTLEPPARPFPGATGGVPVTTPQTYPAGPTYEGWLAGQLALVGWPGVANTWTARQSFAGSTGPLTQHTLTDAATGADSPTMRPTLAQYDHLTTATPVPGIGGSHTWRAQDSAGTIVEIAKVCAEITGITPGLVDATMAFCISHQGQMCEVGRIRAQLGKDATVSANGVYGFLGGEWFMQTYLRVQERFGMGVTPVGVQTLPAAAVDAGTTLTLANALRAALIAFGLGV